MNPSTPSGPFKVENLEVLLGVCVQLRESLAPPTAPKPVYEVVLIQVLRKAR